MNDDKLKHLEFLQNVITRMNSNSFMIKGWSITLVSALFALAAKDANAKYVLISYIVIPTFWVLDGFYLSTEKQYRDLYDKVRLNNGIIDFSMDATIFNSGKNTWFEAIISKTIYPFYLISFITTLIVLAIFHYSKN